MITMNTMKKPEPLKHAKLIKAWADGHTIQKISDGTWVDDHRPKFYDSCEYRVKLEPELYKAGDVFKAGDGDAWTTDDEYILAQTSARMYSLINIKSGNRYRNSVELTKFLANSTTPYFTLEEIHRCHSVELFPLSEPAQVQLTNA